MPKMPQHYRALYDADYWGSWDLENGDKTVTIKRCVGGELTGPGGKKSKKPVLYVEGSEKGIPLNKTNGKTIASMYGNYVADWAGKRITLFKSSTRNPQDGGEIDCIRIRPEKPGNAVAAPSLSSVLSAIKAMSDKPSRDAAKSLAEQLEDDADIDAAKEAYQSRIAEIKAAAAPVAALPSDFAAEYDQAEKGAI